MKKEHLSITKNSLFYDTPFSLFYSTLKWLTSSINFSPIFDNSCIDCSISFTDDSCSFVASSTIFVWGPIDLLTLFISSTAYTNSSFSLPILCTSSVICWSCWRSWLIKLWMSLKAVSASFTTFAPIVTSCVPSLIDEIAFFVR